VTRDPRPLKPGMWFGRDTGSGAQQPEVAKAAERAAKRAGERLAAIKARRVS
jgi:hypothetical protein